MVLLSQPESVSSHDGIIDVIEEEAYCFGLSLFS